VLAAPGGWSGPLPQPTLGRSARRTRILFGIRSLPWLNRDAALTFCHSAEKVLADLGPGDRIARKADGGCWREAIQDISNKDSTMNSDQEHRRFGLSLSALTLLLVSFAC